MVSPLCWWLLVAYLEMKTNSLWPIKLFAKLIMKNEGSIEEVSSWAIYFSSLGWYNNLEIKVHIYISIWLDFFQVWNKHDLQKKLQFQVQINRAISKQRGSIFWSFKCLADEKRGGIRRRKNNNEWSFFYEHLAIIIWVAIRS